MAGSLKNKSFSKPIETKTKFLSFSPKDFVWYIEIITKRETSSKYSNIIKEEVIALADKPMEDESISTKQPSSLLELSSKS